MEVTPMDKMKFESPDIVSGNIEKIAALFPNCVTEMPDENGKIKQAVNFELLKQMLSPDVVDGDEAYEFTWVGKKASIVEATNPSAKRCVPAPKKARTGTPLKISTSRAIIWKSSSSCRKAISAKSR